MLCLGVIAVCPVFSAQPHALVSAGILPSRSVDLRALHPAVMFPWALPPVEAKCATRCVDLRALHPAVMLPWGLLLWKQSVPRVAWTCGLVTLP